jgi:hypothetical protein
MYELRQNIERANVEKQQMEVQERQKADLAIEKVRENTNVMITKAKGE